MVCVKVQTIQVGKLGSNAAEVVPTAAEDSVDFGLGLLGKSACEIGSPDPVFSQQRPDRPGHPASEICDSVRLDQAHALEQTERNYSDQRLACPLEAAAQAPGYPPHGNTARNSQPPCRIPGGFPAAPGLVRNWQV